MKKTLWLASDRQGDKYFVRKPEFIAMHDIFTGERASGPRRGNRIIRNFTAKVIGATAGRYGYPLTLSVKAK